MKTKRFLLTAFISLAILLAFNISNSFAQKPANTNTDESVKLPTPKFSGDVSVEQALSKRRSMRDYQNSPINIEQLSQLLWAAQGITDTSGKRTAPSAGAEYSLKLYVVVGNVTGVKQGFYQYISKGHTLNRLSDIDMRPDIFQISINQLHILNAAFLIIYTEDKNLSKIYDKKAEQKVNTEIGASLQNVFLQGAALDLGVAVSTSWDETKLKDILKQGSNIEPKIIQTIGKKIVK
jgi:SagB-type dehydrogenase family enzyme